MATQLTADTMVSHYRIVSKIGAGGMGEVYRARDARLDRDVAIKLLPAELSQDPDRLKRFAQEAKATSALNHPNILAIHDIGEHEGSPFLVAELLEGEELRERLDHGKIPLRKVVEFAIQLAAGLAAAHAKGIVHRDLKPENLFITRDGRLKILDFGLAKVTGPRSAQVDATAETHDDLTNPGVVLGTIGYMSPEQVVGKPADHRSDIFSFGVILYEMLTGDRAFHADSGVELMNAILKEDVPDLDESSRVPASLEKLMRRCLEKRPEHRFHSAHDLGLALEAFTLTSSSGSSRTGAVAPTVDRGAKDGARWWKLAAVVLGALAAVQGSIAWMRPRAAPAARLEFTPFSFERGGQTSAIWSPDGKAVAFGARQSEGDAYQVHVRYLDSPVARQLTFQTEEAYPVQWTPSDRIIIHSKRSPEGLWSVSPVGGEPEPLMAIPASANAFAVSRDGSAVATLRSDEQGLYGIWISSPPGSEPVRYEPAPFASRDMSNYPNLAFSPDGKQILVMRNAATGTGEEAWLLPHPADAESPPRQILDDMPASSGTPWFSWMPDNRHLVMSTAAGTGYRQLYAADIVSGDLEVLAGGTTRQNDPSISPDGTRLVYFETTRDSDVVAMDLASAAITPVIATQRSESMPSWSAANQALVYVTDRNGAPEIWLKATGQPDRPLVTAKDFPPDTTQWLMGPSLSPDGTRVIYTRIERRAGKIQSWMSSAAGGPPVLLVKSDADRSDYPGSWSPDGAWFVYFSNEAGKYDIRKVRTTGQGSAEELTILEVPGYMVPEWSPTGEWILYDADATLKLISADGATKRDIPTRGMVATFSQDGQSIYAVRNASEGPGGELISMDLTGGSVKVIGSVKFDDLPAVALTPSLRLSRAPDGRSVVYSTLHATGNLWLMEGLDTVAALR